MSDNNQILLVRDQAEDKQQQLSERFEKAVNFVQAERRQLIQLKDYETGYLEKIKEKQQQWTPQNASHYRHFCHQLSQAITEQVEKLDVAEQQLDKMREELRMQQQRINVLDDMVKRDHVAAAKLENQMLQKELDEYSSRLYFR